MNLMKNGKKVVKSDSHSGFTTFFIHREQKSMLNHTHLGDSLIFISLFICYFRIS